MQHVLVHLRAPAQTLPPLPDLTHLRANAQPTLSSHSYSTAFAVPSSVLAAVSSKPLAATCILAALELLRTLPRFDEPGGGGDDDDDDDDDDEEEEEVGDDDDDDDDDEEGCGRFAFAFLVLLVFALDLALVLAGLAWVKPMPLPAYRPRPRAVPGPLNPLNPSDPPVPRANVPISPGASSSA